VELEGEGKKTVRHSRNTRMVGNVVPQGQARKGEAQFQVERQSGGGPKRKGSQIHITSSGRENGTKNERSISETESSLSHAGDSTVQTIVAILGRIARNIRRLHLVARKQ